jgi:hypothetical protein
MNGFKYCLVFILIAVAPAMPQATSVKSSYLRQAEVHESAGSIQIVANSPRPLAQVADALRQKYRWMIDYEDPQFVSPSDLVVVDGPPKQTLPSGGDFKIEFTSNSAQAEKVLKSAVDSYNQSANPGRFEFRRGEGDTFVLVGVQAHDASGKIATQPVPLDATITITNEKRSASAVLDLICQKLSENRQIPVILGVTPRKLLDRTDVSLGGAPASARALLSQTLAATQRRLYWNLIFDPDAKRYLLNVFMIPS